MSRILRTAAGLLTVFALAFAAGDRVMAEDGGVNTLTAAEKSAGWKLLFDGKSLDGWRGFESTTPPEGWKLVDGALTRMGRGGDLVTVDQFGDFELRLQWKLGEGGNSGIFFRARTEGDEIWHSAPEVQVLHNAGHKDGQIPEKSAGSNYALHAPVRDVTKPLGEWNDVRLIVKGPHVEHWMNGVKLLEYRAVERRLGSTGEGKQVRRHPGVRPVEGGTHRAPGSRRSRLLPQHQNQTSLMLCLPDKVPIKTHRFRKNCAESF